MTLLHIVQDEDIYKILSQEVSRNSKILLVPTAGSVNSIILYVYIASRTDIDIVHVLFVFGYWYGFYYPFVPRYFEPIKLLGNLEKEQLDRIKSRWMPAIKFDNEKVNRLLNRLPSLHRSIAELALEVNKKLRDPMLLSVEDKYPDIPIPDIKFECIQKDNRAIIRFEIGGMEIDKIEINNVDIARVSRILDRMQQNSKIRKGTGEADVKVLVNSIYNGNIESNLKNIISLYVVSLCCSRGFTGKIRDRDIRKGAEDVARQLLYMSGLITFNDKILKEIEYKYRSIIIDTNMIYRGIHNYARRFGDRILVPYCVDFEIRSKLAEAKSIPQKVLHYCVWLSYKVLIKFARIIPSYICSCDYAIPKIDPDFILNSCIMTCDKHASQAWKRQAVRKYTRIRLLRDDYNKSDFVHIHNIELQKT